MNGRTPTKDEKVWMNAIANLGCIVCRLHLSVFTPPEIHHIDGSRKIGSHFKTIPLCARHHRIGSTHSNPLWISLHGNGRKVFAREYDTELVLLEKCRDLVAETHILTSIV